MEKAGWEGAVEKRAWTREEKEKPLCLLLSLSVCLYKRKELDILYILLNLSNLNESRKMKNKNKKLIKKHGNAASIGIIRENLTLTIYYTYYNNKRRM